MPLDSVFTVLAGASAALFALRAYRHLALRRVKRRTQALIAKAKAESERETGA